MNNNTKVVMGTLGAALAGAAAGVLLAPKKGTETRSMIKNKVNDLSSNAKQTFDKGYEKSKKTINELTDKVKSSLQGNGRNGSAGTGYQKNEHYVAETAAPMSGTTASGTKSYTSPGTGTTSPGSASTPKSNPMTDTNRNFGNTTK